MTTRAGFAVLLCLAACELQPADPGPAPEPFTVTPPSVTILVGASIQFEARSTASGAPVPVRWEVNPVSGLIDQTGRFTASACGLGTGIVRAVLLADTSRSATAQVNLIVLLPARIGISSITDVATQAPVKIDSISGPVEVVVSVAGSTCYQVTSASLVLSSAAGALTVASVDFPSPPTTNVIRTLLWNPGLYPNGPYNLNAVLTVAGGSPEGSPVLAIQIRHP